MYNKIRKEMPWIVIFILTQIGLFLFNYREFETTFYPAVSRMEVVHVYEQNENNVVVNVAFRKLRGCEFLGLRMTDKFGRRVAFKFLDQNPDYDDSYISRPKGYNLAGPWDIQNSSWDDIQVESLHRCDIFGVTTSILQVIEDK